MRGAGIVGNKTLRSDACNWPTKYTLDALSRPTSVQHNDGTRVTNTFDALSQQTGTWDASGITTNTFDYEGASIGGLRALATKLPDATDQVLSHNWRVAMVVFPPSGGAGCCCVPASPPLQRMCCNGTPNPMCNCRGTRPF